MIGRMRLAPRSFTNRANRGEHPYGAVRVDAAPLHAGLSW